MEDLHSEISCTGYEIHTRSIILKKSMMSSVLIVSVYDGGMIKHKATLSAYTGHY